MYCSRETNSTSRSKPQRFIQLDAINFLDSRSYLKSQFDTASPSSTPKNISIKKLFQKRDYLQSRQNEEMQYINHPNNYKLHQPSRNKNHNNFEYESLSRKNTSTAIQKEESGTSTRVTSEPCPETFEIYSSIQNNLSECDKIILKLKGISLNPRNQQYKLSSQSTSNKIHDKLQRIQQKPKFGENSEPSQTKTSISKSNLQESIYPNSLNPQIKKLANSMGSISSTPQSKCYSIQKQKYDPIINLRRQRIYEIIKKRKNSQIIPLQRSFNRIKQRGQKMFSKMIRARDKSIDHQSLLEFEY